MTAADGSPIKFARRLTLNLSPLHVQLENAHKTLPSTKAMPGGLGQIEFVAAVTVCCASLPGNARPIMQALEYQRRVENRQGTSQTNFRFRPVKSRFAASHGSSSAPLSSVSHAAQLSLLIFL